MKKFLSGGVLSLLLLLSVSIPVLAVEEPANPIDSLIKMDNLVSADADKICFESTSLLSKSRSGTEQDFRKDFVEILPNDAESTESILAEVARGNGEKYLDEIDSSGTATIYTTVFYTTTVQNGQEMVDITRITGGYTMSGSAGTVVTGHDVTYGQSSFGNTQNDSRSYTAGTKSWTITPPSSWAPVPSNYPSTVGCFYTLDLQRTSSGSTWSVDLSNNLF